MKIKVSISDKENKTISKEINIRQKKQYDALRNHRSQIFKNKKAYNRKEKYKGRLFDESSFFFNFLKKEKSYII